MRLTQRGQAAAASIEAADSRSRRRRARVADRDPEEDGQEERELHEEAGKVGLGAHHAAGLSGLITMAIKAHAALNPAKIIILRSKL